MMDFGFYIDTILVVWRGVIGMMDDGLRRNETDATEPELRRIVFPLFLFGGCIYSLRAWHDTSRSPVSVCCREMGFGLINVRGTSLWCCSPF